MPSHQQITQALMRAKRIREYAAEFRELNLERIAEIHPTTEDKKDVRLFVVKLPNRTSKQEAA